MKARSIESFYDVEVMIYYLQIIVDRNTEVPIESSSAETSVSKQFIIFQDNVPYGQCISSMMCLFRIGIIDIEDAFFIIISP